MTIDEQIACVRREIAMRERVYPSWVARGKMKQEKADHETAAMRAVLRTLVDLQNIDLVRNALGAAAAAAAAMYGHAKAVAESDREST